MKWKSLSCVQLFGTPWTVAHQAPLSMEFSRQEYWSGLPYPTPGIFPTKIEPRSPTLQTDSLPSEPWGKHCISYLWTCINTKRQRCGKIQNKLLRVVPLEKRRRTERWEGRSPLANAEQIMRNSNFILLLWAAFHIHKTFVNSGCSYMYLR